MTQTLAIDIWSDIACPWCYLGKHRFEKALAEFSARPDAPQVDVTWHSYQLNPGMETDYSGTHADYMAQHLGWDAEKIAAADRHLQTLGADYGLVYDFDKNRMTNTLKAHELLHFAKENGRQDAVKEGLFKAYFSDGRHIGRIEELADIAAEAGLDRAAALQALESGAYREAVEADMALATRYGIRGVPFFVLASKYGVSGAQEPDTFLGALTQAAAEGAAA
jgi:predicted DsbA family dithiol-disulfide isomerase